MKRRAKIIVIALLVIAIIFLNINYSFYKVESVIQKSYYSFISREMATIETAHFIIKYEDKKEAELVARIAEKYYEPVCEIYRYKTDKKIPIIIHSDIEAMNRAVYLKSEQVPMGIFSGKTIQILSPKIWIKEEELEEIFEKQGPIIHEMSHYIVDDITKGNYDQWLFEGLALYTEYLYTGYVIGKDKEFDILYTIDELEKNFSQLDTIKAYYSSFIIIKTAIEENHVEYLDNMLE